MKPKEKEVLSIKSIYCAEICAGVVSRQLKKALKAYKERVEKIIINPNNWDGTKANVQRRLLDKLEEAKWS